MALDSGVKEKKNMKKKQSKTIYTDEPMLIGKRVPDFLPSPEELKNARVRIYLKGKIHSEYVLHDGKRKDS